MRCAVETDELEYEERGDGRPIILVHGLTTDRRILVEACEPALARPGLRRIYLDLPGHGDSSANLAGASADGLVATLRGFMRALGVEDAAIVAHSYGAYLALGLARDVPTARGLFLICPIVFPDPGWRRVPRQRYAILEDGLQFVDDLERETYDAEVSVHTQATLLRFRQSVDPAHRKANRPFVDRVRAYYAMSTPLTGGLGKFDRPVHILCGQNDYWAGYEDALQLLRVLPRCDLSVVSGCGHFLPVEKPGRLGTALEAWLRELSESSAADDDVG